LPLDKRHKLRPVAGDKIGQCLRIALVNSGCQVVGHKGRTVSYPIMVGDLNSTGE
jgi:hypothetical protein